MSYKFFIHTLWFVESVIVCRATEVFYAMLRILEIESGHEDG